MATSESQATCERHPQEAVTSSCVECGKPVCRECAKQFGYHCSQACIEKGRSKVTEQTRQRQRATEAALRKTARLGKLMFLALGSLVAAALLAIVWTLFLDPAGKLRWQWQAPAGQGATRILAADDTGVTVLAGNTVVVLDPATGTEARTFVLPKGGTAGSAAGDGEGQEQEQEEAYGWDGGLGGGNLQVLRDGGILRRTHDTLARVSSDGAVKFAKTYAEGSIGHLALSPDLSRAFYVATVPVDVAVARQGKALLRQTQAELEKAFEAAGGFETGVPADTAKLKALRQKMAAAQEMLAQTRTGIICLDLQSGQETWATPKMKKGTAVTALSAGANAVYAVFTSTTPSASRDDDDTIAVSLSLFALNAADGSRLWQAELPMALEWGPTPAGDMVLVQAGESLKAFAADGAEAYTLPLPGKTRAQPLLRNGVLLLIGDTSCRCLDAATGKEKWGVLLATGDRDIVVAEKRLYLAGQIEEHLADKDVKLPPAYKELEKMPELSGVLEQAKKKVVQVVLAVDRESGKELWRIRNAYGTPLGNDARFILVADTAQTSLIEMATGGKGMTIVRQFNAKNGKQMYLRQSDLGFAEPHLVGKRIIGLTYARTERPSAFNPGAGMEGLGPTLPQGLAAYRTM
jgi:outer membrane protein assembly factor BamB